MNNRIGTLCLATAMAAAGCAAPVFAVPFADESEIVSETLSHTPGELHWHRAGGGTPYLSIGSIGGGREALVDPFALHRERYSPVEPPAYSVTLGDDVTVSNGWFVLFARRADTSETVTRSVSIVPAEGYRLRRVEVENGRASAAAVDIASGGTSATISCTSAKPPPGMATYTDCAFRLLAVFASVGAGDPQRDDLTQGDYLFTDTVGECSLGRLREWCLGQLRGRLADSWSRYPATESVRLADSPLVFDRLARFRTGLVNGTNDLDTLAIYAGGKAAVEIVSEVSDSYSGFRIVDFRQTATNVCLWVTAIGTNCTAETSTALSSAMVWTEEENVTVDYTPTKVDGIDCYLISFPCGPANSSAGMRFWRARTFIGTASQNAVRFNVPVILTSPNGFRWELRVSDDGTLSTVAAP